jgi:hypothetical protein
LVWGKLLSLWSKFAFDSFTFVPMLNPPLRIVHLSSAHPDHDVRIFFKECCTLAAAFPEVEIHLILAGVQERKESGVFVHSVPKGSGNRIQRMRPFIKKSHSIKRRCLSFARSGIIANRWCPTKAWGKSCI